MHLKACTVLLLTSLDRATTSSKIVGKVGRFGKVVGMSESLLRVVAFISFSVVGDAALWRKQ
jgi:hypothetical protein